jgi:hypothetical protein
MSGLTSNYPNSNRFLMKSGKLSSADPHNELSELASDSHEIAENLRPMQFRRSEIEPSIDLSEVA